MTISHLAFADDLMIFTRGDYRSVQIMFNALKDFGRVSGLQANALKSDIYIVGVEVSQKIMILNYMGFSAGSIPFRYLGIPLSRAYLRVAEYEPLLEKVSKTVFAWSGLNISYAGRVEIVKSVVQGIQSFWLGVLPITAAVLDRIIGVCRRFI